MHIRLYKIFALILALFLLTACFGGGASAPIKYYLLDPVDYSNKSLIAVRPLSIEIIDLHIPQYLERFHIATRSTESQLEFSEYNQWGENFRKNLLRTMARNLSKLLSTIDIGTPLNRSASTPDYRLQIHIEQFEKESSGNIKLVARWQLSKSAEKNVSEVFAAEFESQKIIEAEDYEGMIAEMRKQYGMLSEKIAESILAEEN